MQTTFNESFHCKYIVLSNFLKVLLFSNENCKSSYFTLNVEAGSYNDPQKCPGLAHLVEHMIFRGSKNFDNGESYESFCSRNGIFPDATTLEDYVIYSAKVQPKFYEELLDRLVDAIVYPTFNKDFVDKEISVINQEYHYIRPDIYYKTKILNSNILNADHQRNLLECGNEETLKQESILENVKEFHKKHYYTDNMTLILCSAHPISELEKIAEKFKIIPSDSNRMINININEEIPSLYHTKFDSRSPYKPKFSNKIIKVNEDIDVQKAMSISIILPPSQKLYETNPFGYLKKVFNENGPNSLNSYLSTHGLIESMESDFIQTHKSVDILINFYLTDKGLKNYRLILDILTEYLRNLKADELKYQMFNEDCSEIINIYEDRDVQMIFQQLSKNMHFCSYQDVFSANICFEKFDADLINNIISELANYKKWGIFIFDRNDSFYQLKSKYGNLKFKVLCNYKNYPHKFLIDNEKDSPELNFDEPEFYDDPYDDKNKGKDLVQEIVNENGKRISIEKICENGKVLFIFDSQFKSSIVKVKIKMILNNPKKCLVRYDVYLKMVECYLNDKYYKQISESFLDFQIKLSNQELVIKIKTLNNIILDFIKSIHEALINPKLQYFEIAVNKMKNVYKKREKGDETHVMRQKLTKFITNDNFDLNQYLRKLKMMKSNDMFLFDEYYLDIKVAGNMKYNDVDNIYEILKSTGKEIKPVDVMPKKTIEYDFKERTNNVVCVYFIDQLPENSIKKEHYIRSLQLIKIRKSFSFKMRNNEMQAYIASAFCLKAKSYRIYNLHIMSKEKESFIRKKIYDFLGDFEDSLQLITEEEFLSLKEIYLANYLEDEKSVFDIKLCKDLDLNKKKLEILNSITIEEFKKSLFDIYESYLLTTTNKNMQYYLKAWYFEQKDMLFSNRN